MRANFAAHRARRRRHRVFQLKFCKRKFVSLANEDEMLAGDSDAESDIRAEAIFHTHCAVEEV
jgi:hypothetical protein